MVRLAALVLGAGLAAAKTVDLSASPASASIRFPESSITERADVPLLHEGRHIVPHANVVRPLLVPPTVGKRDGSFHSSSGSEYSQHGGGYSGGQSFGPTGHSGGGGYSSGGGGYTQNSYSSYEPEGYGYTEATTYDNDGGFLGGFGKYGLILIPILLGITLLFLFPSVLNIASTARNNRALGEGGVSDDLLQRAMDIYTSVSEDPLCVNRLFCEMGSTLGHTSVANRTLQYIDYFLPSKGDNLQVLKKAARAEDPQCHMLVCKAWEDKSAALLASKRSAKKDTSATEKKASSRQQRM